LSWNRGINTYFISFKLKEIIFTIIIPTFNRAKLVCSTIQSILAQRNASFEIIVVDDGGWDNTFQLISKLNDTRIKYVKTENRERGAARNSGLQIANGVYVNYFDSDDLLTSSLSEIEEFILNNNSPDIIYGLIENISEDGRSIEVVKPPYSNFKTNILHNNFLACGSVFVKRQIALQYLFSEDRRLSGTEDWELWLRLYSMHDFVRFPKVVFKQRQHPLRSLVTVPVTRVIERETIFIEHIDRSQGLLLKRFSKSELDLLIADRYTLIALAQCESGMKKQGLRYLFKSLNSALTVLGRKRFWAILKKLILD
jgi:glycosyltransferase involved in cell wall biosynthesis